MPRRNEVQYEELQKLTKRAHNLAAAELQDLHRDEYQRLVTKHREALGIPYTAPGRSRSTRRKEPGVIKVRTWDVEAMRRRLAAAAWGEEGEKSGDARTAGAGGASGAVTPKKAGSVKRTGTGGRSKR
jgi:hypothetical protein